MVSIQTPSDILIEIKAPINWHVFCSRVGMIEGVFEHDNNYGAANKLLDVTLLKHKANASNLANIETPGYKRLQVASAFESQLDAEITKGDMAKLAVLEPYFERDTQTPSVRADGNNVEIDHELVEMNRNTLQHEYLGNVISNSIRRLKMAIVGRGNV